MISNNSYFDRRILLLLIALQALLFYNFYYREIASYPPQDFDQGVYLTEAYRLQEQIHAKGLGELWKTIWSTGHPSGILLPIEGALSGVVLGGGRLPQLCLNFIAFAVLEVVAFYAARAVWDRRVYGYATVGLILCQLTPWFWAGGEFDFRMDFLAYCLYGVWACAVMRSKHFLDRRWAIGSGLIGAFLVLHRFFTVAYLLGVSAGLGVACVVLGYLCRRNCDLVNRMWRRICNLGLSFGVSAIIVAPFLIVNRIAIFNYYVFGHGMSEEKYVRAREAGIGDLAGHLLYYPKSILNDHLGATFLWGSALAIAGGLITRLLWRSKNARKNSARGPEETFSLQVIFLLGAILGPIVVLTADTNKSPVVGGIVGVPAALFIVCVAARLAPTLIEAEAARGAKLVTVCSLAVFALGLFQQFDHASRHLPLDAQRRDLERLAKLDKWLEDYASDQGWRNPRISSDVVSGWFFPPAITASGYEQTRQLVEFRQMLGGGDIMGVSQQEALSLLANSDFVILTSLPKTGVYPFYQRIAQYWGDLKAWACKNMIMAQTVQFDSFTATVYLRPSAIISGLSGDWVTSDGLAIEAPRAALQRFPEIRISGVADYSRLPKIPTVSATIDTIAGAQIVPASLRELEDGYEIVINTSSMELPPSDPVRLRLMFDTFFVPKKLGINNDTRELVVRAPTLVQLIRPAS